VSRFLFLDSAPLGLITHPQQSVRVAAITEWLSRCILSGDRVIVPAIVYYELKRELLRAKKTAGIARLDAFVRATPGRYLPLSDEALRLAAELWARARQGGQPSSDRTALDIDVILAAQALSFGPAPSDVIVATTNAKHFTQFVTARDWSEIVP
jgi:predicted nucleic acid-binding protein